MSQYRISVCIATYNGEEYIFEQIKSILKQIKENDEIIVVDDCSKDKTVDIIKKISDKRIRIYINDINLGVNKNFEKAILKSKNEYIFLSDQDDIWIDNRVEFMMEELLKKDVNVVAGNSLFINKNGEKIDYDIRRLRDVESNSAIKNLVKIFKGNAAYYGCAMGFNRDLLKIVVPIPQYVESHDLWIAKAGITTNSIKHINENVVIRRLHGNNASIVNRKIHIKIYSRFIFLISLFELFRRKKKYSI